MNHLSGSFSQTIAAEHFIQHGDIERLFRNLKRHLGTGRYFKDILNTFA
jgi:hypothetical protein